MPSWHAATATVVGPKHRSTGRGGQDASASRAVEGGQVIAIADGHGSERCYRSDRGAELAVQAAIDVLGQHAARAGERLATGAEAIPDALVEAWRRSVSADIGAHPFGTLPIDSGPEEDKPFTAYGTTVLAGVARGTELVLAQLGDGESLVVAAGAIPRRALARDPMLAADMTTSLALDDAPGHLRLACLGGADEPVDLLLLASDGYANAFTDDAAFEQVASDLVKWLGARDPGWVAGELPAWLEHSAGISGDDASLGLLYRWPLRPAD